MAESNEQLSADVLNALTYDAGVDESNIAVYAEGGRITLSGSVGSDRERVRAVDDARGVSGVADVRAADLLVTPARPARDADLEEELQRALVADPRIPASVFANVVDDWVTLAGTADSEDERDVALESARGLPGVRGVTNAIVVRRIA